MKVKCAKERKIVVVNVRFVGTEDVKQKHAEETSALVGELVLAEESVMKVEMAIFAVMGVGFPKVSAVLIVKNLRHHLLQAHHRDRLPALLAHGVFRQPTIVVAENVETILRANVEEIILVSAEARQLHFA